MGSIGTPVVRRMIDVADARHNRDELLESVGLSSDPAGVDWAGDSIDEEIYYALLERIHLDDEQLARRAVLADDGLSTYLLSRLDDLTARKTRRSIVDDVRAVIADALPDGQPSKSQIARRLAISERTLHRQLADHGETFQSIATQARRDAAESLLATTSHPIADVAFLTGFSDQTAFTRAFKRWTGTTPAAFRDHTG